MQINGPTPTSDGAGSGASHALPVLGLTGEGAGPVQACTEKRNAHV